MIFNLEIKVPIYYFLSITFAYIYIVNLSPLICVRIRPAR